MSDVMFNIGKGRAVELYKRVKDADPANCAFVVILLQSSVADAALIDFPTVNDILGDISNTEADFTNYLRLYFTAADLDAMPIADNASDWYPLTFPDAIFTNAGGALNNTLSRLILAFDYDTTSGDDTNLIPIGAFDYNGTTDGSTLGLEFPPAAFTAS